MKVELVDVAVAQARLGGTAWAASLAASASYTLLLTEGPRATGVLQLETLSFDSELFGRTAARLSVLVAETEAGYAALLSACRAECAARDIHHVVRRLPVGGFLETWGLEGAGYRMVDVSVLFERSVPSPLEVAVESGLRPVRPADVEPLAEGLAGAFTLTRFAVDPFVSEAAALELHRRWIRNSCAGRADCVLVAEGASGLSGFVTCRVDAASETGNIELIAVDAAQRGSGTGRRLVAGALGWFVGKVKRVQVRTQLNNTVAIGLYQGAGFRLQLGELTYAWMSGKGR